MALSEDEFKFLKRTFQNIDPNKPLEPGNPFYQPVYKGDDGSDPVERLKTQIKFSDVQSRHFFSGFRGSGKTTELLRLKQDLEEEGYLVFYANALEYINPALPIEISDLLVILAGAFSDKLHDFDPAIEESTESYWTRFTHFLNKSDVELKEFSFTMKDVASVKASLRETPSFRQRIQAVLTTRLAELENQTKKFFEDCVAAIRIDRPDTPIVFLFDQLEQLRGSRITDQDVLTSVERLFSQHLDRLHLPFIHVVYTVPPWLRFILPGTLITILPSIRQWGNDGARTPYAFGNDCLFELLKKRFGGEPPLFRVFGNRQAVDRLIHLCGGQFRDLFRLVIEVLTRATALPVSSKVIDSAILEIRASYLPIALSDAVWLQKIADSRTHGLPTSTPEDVNRFTHYLDNHVVLFLRNGEEWYDIHPLIRDNVAEIANQSAPLITNG